MASGFMELVGNSLKMGAAIPLGMAYCRGEAMGRQAAAPGCLQEGTALPQLYLGSVHGAKTQINREGEPQSFPLARQLGHSGFPSRSFKIPCPAGKSLLWQASALAPARWRWGWAGCSACWAGQAAGTVTQLGKTPDFGKTLLVLVWLKGGSFRASLW